MINFSDFLHRTQGSIQGDSGGKVSILGSYIIGHCEKKVYMITCLITNGY